MVTLRISYYAPPDTREPGLRAVAFEYLQSIEGAGRICWSAPFCGEFFGVCRHQMPSHMRGRWHGEAVTDEVEAAVSMRRCPPHQSPPATASPHRGSHWICENPNAFLQGKALGACKYEKLPRKKVQPDKFRMHLLFMAVVLRQLVSNLTPPYQAARSRNS